jgi:hypothetical protein
VNWMVTSSCHITASYNCKQTWILCALSGWVGGWTSRLRLSYNSLLMNGNIRFNCLLFPAQAPSTAMVSKAQYSIMNIAFILIWNGGIYKALLSAQRSSFPTSKDSVS